MLKPNYWDHPDWPNWLSAIRAAPDDDLPRLACADWLDEHGYGERAEFVRVQVAMSQAKTVRAKRDVRRKINFFMRGAVTIRRYSWFNHILDDTKMGLSVDGWKCAVGGTSTVTFRRGFLHTVRAPLATLYGGECERCDGTGLVMGHWDPASDTVRGRTRCGDCAGPNPPPGYGGTGFTAAVLPELVRREPVLRVEVADLEIIEFGDGFGIYSRDVPEPVSLDEHLHGAVYSRAATEDETKASGRMNRFSDDSIGYLR